MAGTTARPRRILSSAASTASPSSFSGILRVWCPHCSSGGAASASPASSSFKAGARARTLLRRRFHQISDFETAAGNDFRHRRGIVQFGNLNHADLAAHPANYLSAGGVFDLLRHALDRQLIADLEAGPGADIQDHLAGFGVRDQSLDDDRARL